MYVLTEIKSYSSVFKILGWRVTALAILGIIEAGCLVIGSNFETAIQLYAVFMSWFIGCLAILWIVCDQQFALIPVSWIFALALLIRLITVQATPLLEDDHYRYLWDGFRTVTTGNPYQFSPSEFINDSSFYFQLSSNWQDILNSINYPEIPTIYGPVLQSIFALGYFLTPGEITGIQYILLFVDCLIFYILVQQKIGSPWLLIYAFHPLILKEVIASAHPDGLVTLFILCALISWQKRQPLITGVLLGIGLATKISTLVVVPIFFLLPHSYNLNKEWALKMMLGLALSLVILYIPFIILGHSEVKALAIFGQEWRFNPLGYRIFEMALSPSSVRWFSGTTIVLGIIIILGYSKYYAMKKNILPPVDLIFLIVLLFSPVVNPWYWIWGLALSIYFQRQIFITASIISVVSYLNTTVLLEAGFIHKYDEFKDFHISWPITILQLSIIIFSCLYEWQKTPKKFTYFQRQETHASYFTST